MQFRFEHPFMKFFYSFFYMPCINICHFFPPSKQNLKYFIIYKLLDNKGFAQNINSAQKIPNFHNIEKLFSLKWPKKSQYNLMMKA